MRLDRWMRAGALVGLVAFVVWLIWITFIYGDGVSDWSTGELVLGAFVVLLFSTLWAIVFALVALGVGASIKLLLWVAGASHREGVVQLSEDGGETDAF